MMQSLDFRLIDVYIRDLLQNYRQNLREPNKLTLIVFVLTFANII